MEEAEQQFFNLLVDDERGFLLPAVLFAGMGHRHRGLRAGRIRTGAGSRADAGGRLAADEGSPPQRRLEREAAERRAVRLVFRIRQRVLSRHRRHRAGAAGACAVARHRCREAGRLHAARGRLAAGHAIERRRLGGVRRRQQLAIPELGAVRGSQRDARSDVSGYHRPRARSADALAASSRIIRRCGAASNI